MDYVAFAAIEDVDLTKAMVTMLLPLRGGLLPLEAGAPHAKFAENIVMIGVWTPRSASDANSRYLSECLSFHPKRMLIVKEGAQPPQLPVGIAGIIVRTGNDAIENRRLITNAIEEARRG